MIANQTIQDGIKLMMIENLSQNIKETYENIMNRIKPNLGRQREEFKSTQYYQIFGR